MVQIRKLFEKSLVFICFTIIFIVVIFPIFWTITAAFKDLVDLTAYPPKFLFKPTLLNFFKSYDLGIFGNPLIMSLIVSLGAIGLAFALGVPAAYIFARYNFRRKSDIKFWILSARMMPPIAIVIPFYRIWLGVGLYNTPLALIFSYLLITLPLTIWLMTSYFQEIPIIIEDAAKLDGCTQFEVFYKISLPLSLPALAVVMIFCLVMVWNEFFIAFVLTSTNITLPVIVGAATKYGSHLPWGLVASNCTVLMIPAVILALFTQRFLKYLIPRI
jgi:multiple sugar transport system permease protein